MQLKAKTNQQRLHVNNLTLGARPIWAYY